MFMNAHKSDSLVDDRLTKAISSIFENRLPIFLPMQKLHQSKINKIFKENDNKLILKTNFGEIECRNRLVTQNHKAYLEAMLSYEKKPLTDNSFYVEFKIYDLLDKKLKKKNPTDYDTFKKYLKELKDLHIVLKSNNKEFGFSFIDDYAIDNKTGAYKIKFTRIFSYIWMNESLISYKNGTSALNNINDVIVQSVIRYMITYSNIQISVKNLGKKLSYDKIFGIRDLFNKLNHIRQSFKKDNFKKIYKIYGITYDKDFDNIIINRSKETFINHKKDTLTQNLNKKCTTA